MISDEIIFKSSNSEVKIDINIYSGNHHFFLVMTGLGGNVIGYNSKYEKIANNINSKYGCTVIVASTPKSSWMHAKDNFENIMEYVHSFALKNDYFDYDISIFGYSAGGTFATWYSYQYSKIKKLLIVNPVLTVNTHRLKEGLKKFNGDSIAVIFGEFDQCIKYLPLLDNVNPLSEIFVLKNINHTFKDNIELFIELPEKYLFNKKNR